MSTTIYDGLIFKSQNISELFKILYKLNSEIKEKAYDIGIQFIAKNFVDCFDLKTNLNDIIDDLSTEKNKKINKRYYLNNDDKLLSILISMFNDKCKESFNKKERDLEFDYSISLGIYTSSKGILIIPFYEKSEYFKIVKKYFVEYHYWNNTDKDVLLTEKEWYNRGKVWNNALDKECLIYKIFKDYDNIIDFYIHSEEEITKKILTHIPTKEERALSLATNEIHEKVFKKLFNSYKPEEAKDKIFTIYSESNKILKNEESIREINNLKNIWLEKIEDITIETLNNYKAPKIIEKLDDFNYVI